MRGTLALGLLGLAAGCAAPPPSCPAGMAPAREIAAFFGRHVTGGAAPPQRIDDGAWAAFQAAELTPRFPEGATALQGQGIWRDAAGRVATEDSTVLLLIVPADRAAEALSRLQAAIAVYRRRFRQDSVGISLRATCAAGMF